jgi:hypothetical protein
MVVPLTNAVNSCRWSTTTLVCAGDTDTVISEVEPRMTAALAEAVRSASDVAVTVMTVDAGAVAGARYNPSLVIWPHAIPLQVVPARLQRTTPFEVPLTRAVNWVWPPGCTCTLVGVSETDTDAKVTAGHTTTASKIDATFKPLFISSPP